MASLRILPGRYPLAEQVSKQRVKEGVFSSFRLVKH